MLAAGAAGAMDLHVALGEQHVVFEQMEGALVHRAILSGAPSASEGQPGSSGIRWSLAPARVRYAR